MNSVRYNITDDPIEKWYLVQNPRKRVQLDLLEKYALKFKFEKSEAEIMREKANLIPTLEVLNMKLLARVWKTLYDENVVSGMSIDEMFTSDRMNYDKLNTAIDRILPKELPAGAKRMSVDAGLIYRYRYLVTWLRYAIICSPYLDLNESLTDLAVNEVLFKYNGRDINSTGMNEQRQDIDYYLNLSQDQLDNFLSRF